MESYLDNIEEFPRKVYNIFCDFFGESLVDIHKEESEEEEDPTKYSLIVRFPEVIIRNEYGEQRTVKELYVRVYINPDGSGTGSFQITRSSFTIDEISARYIHSHVTPLNLACMGDFRHCCLGTGPIASTCALLVTGYSEDYWKLFCLELSKYVTVESIAGGPYVRMSSIGSLNNKISLEKVFTKADNTNAKVIIDNFLPYYMAENNLKFCYNKGIYSLGISRLDYLLDVSNAFIKWANTNKGIASAYNALVYMHKCYLNNGILYNSSYSRERLYSEYSEYDNLPMFYFKGNLICTSVIDLKENNETTSLRTLLWDIASIVLYRILMLVNYIYGNPEKETCTDKVLFQI